jgi:activator of 2-hydroxyglutaryl-CoA dehydratase
LDVGSITVKAVVADASTGAVVWRGYERHEGRQPDKVLTFLQRIERDTVLPLDRLRVFITGSGGKPIAPQLARSS